MPRPGGRRGPGGFEKSKDFKGSMIRLIKNLKPWKYVMGLALSLAMISAILALVAPNRLSKFADLIGEGLVPNTEVMQTIVEEMSKNEVPKDIVIDGVTITVEDQMEMIKLYQEMGDGENNEKALAAMDKLPESVYSLVEPKMDMEAIKNLAIFMGIIYGLSSLFAYIQEFSLTTVSNRYANKLRDTISKKINRLPLKYFDTHETGDVLSRVTNDIDTVSFNLNNSLATLVTAITMFLGSLTMMLITNWIMALVAVVACLLGLLCMSVILKKSQKYFIAKQEALGELNGYVEEMYSGHNVVRVYNGTKETFKEFEKLNNRLYETNRKSQFLSDLMRPIMGFAGNLGYVAVCVVGALLTMNDVISFGVIVAFMIYVRMFNNPLNQIAQAMSSLQSTAAASERVFEFLDEKEMSDQKDAKKHLDKSKVKGDIEFKNVKFGYDPGKTIIKDFSVKVKPGQKIAIVGPTGAGKTTMVNLLMKFYEINNGQIIIDGVPTSELTRENIHELFIMVLQDTWLFEGTIGDNIRFNKEDVTDREVWQALKTVGVHHFVKTLPGGLDYVVGDNDTISQGQKQLLTIARGMIEDAPLLILDEATSNVDTRTEELVQKAMDKLTEGRTSFIIAHRLSTIKNADLILVMNEGNIIEQGSHEELMKQHGFYESLYNSQFEKTI
jgi:ATP-binding cassette subfamily B protein